MQIKSGSKLIPAICCVPFAVSDDTCIHVNCPFVIVIYLSTKILYIYKYRF